MFPLDCLNKWYIKSTLSAETVAFPGGLILILGSFYTCRTAFNLPFFFLNYIGKGIKHGKCDGVELRRSGRPTEKNRSKKKEKSRGSQCVTVSQTDSGLTHTGPVYDIETLNDMWEPPSCPLLRKHMIRRPYLIHDKPHVPGLERAQEKKQQSGWKEQMDRETDIRSVHPGTQTKAFLPAFKSHIQSYFIQRSTAITVSSHRQSECVISSIFLKADSLTITEQLLLFWQPKSCHWSSVWVFLPVKPVSTNTCAILFFSILCPVVCFLFLHSSCFYCQNRTPFSPDAHFH